MDILDTRENLNAMVLKHEQQIKDIAAHLLELKQLVTPMMEFKQDAAAKADYERGFDDGFILRKEKDGKRTWVGLTDEEVGGLTVFDGLHHIETPLLADYIRHIQAKLKEKNT